MKADHQGGQFVVFRLGAEQYGISISAVREIVDLEETTRLPHMPDFFEGVVDLRGRIIPIINLRKAFGVPPLEGRRARRTVVTEIGDREVGVLVDEVTGVVRLSQDEIQAPPDMVRARQSVVSGVARVGGGLVIVLDPNLLVSAEDHRRVLACLDQVHPA